MTDSGDTRQATILFVDDTIALVEEMPRILERQGHRVVAASRPAEALNIIRQELHIDMAVIDLHLPIGDCREIGYAESGGGIYAGFVIAQELRRKFRRCPVIFWSTASS